MIMLISFCTDKTTENFIFPVSDPSTEADPGITEKIPILVTICGEISCSAEGWTARVLCYCCCCYFRRQTVTSAYVIWGRSLPGQMWSRDYPAGQRSCNGELDKLRRIEEVDKISSRSSTMATTISTQRGQVGRLCLKHPPWRRLSCPVSCATLGWSSNTLLAKHAG